LEIVSQFGAKITWLNGDLIVEKAKKPTPIVVDLTNNPDLFPILSILACGAIGTSVFTSTDRLIHKESNRLETVQEMLTALGVSFTVGKNTIEIHGKGFVDGGVINSFNDHRIAMAAAISACISTSKIQLTNPTCIEKSYPMFFNDLGL
jgi:3-phosphoshikimate 1-carboxyvinyltransferase